MEAPPLSNVWMSSHCMSVMESMTKFVANVMILVHRLLKDYAIPIALQTDPDVAISCPSKLYWYCYLITKDEHMQAELQQPTTAGVLSLQTAHPKAAIHIDTSDADDFKMRSFPEGFSNGAHSLLCCSSSLFPN